MTAPTQPPDPRVQRIAQAITPFDVGSNGYSYALARVLVEELGGREENEPVEKADPRIAGWMEVCTEIFKLFPTIHTDMRQIPVHSRQAAAIRQFAAQQRENAETIAALKERVSEFEYANKMLDNARKSAEQSARDLRENNATLRAELDAINTKTEHDQALMDTQAKLIVDLETELDAIKGAQVPYRWTVVVKDRMSFTFTSLGSAQTWANGEGGEVIPLYRHPAPTLPVVGACVVRKDGRVIEWSSTYEDADGAARNALHYVRSTGDGTAHQLLRGAPIPTEGGK